MKIGFIGLGNVGAKLAGSLLRNGFDLTVRDVDQNLTDQFKNLGAKVANSGKELAEQVDLVITSLPSLKVSAEVMEAEDGVLQGLSENKIWLEMSTTDEAEAGISTCRIQICCANTSQSSSGFANTAADSPASRR